MKAKIGFFLRFVGIGVLAATTVPVWSQTTPTPKPTAVPFLQSCVENTLDADANLITNGDLTQGTLEEGQSPDVGWILGQDSPVLRSEAMAADKVNFYLQFQNTGSSISAVPKTSTYTRFDLSFCAVIPAGGQIKIVIGGVLVAGVPAVAGSEYIGSFSLKDIVIPLGSGSSQSEKTIEFYYDGPSGIGPAYLDNILLLPSVNSGEDDPTPSPTPEVPTPTPKPTGPSPTPTPTIKPGIPTPTATPAIVANSVQMSANPPMLVVSPDDFTGTNQGPRKQVSLDLNVIGSNGKKIDILAIDEDATIKFIVDTRGEAEGVGVVQGFENGSQNWQSIDNRQMDLSDFMGTYLGRACFFPLKTFTGIVRVIVEIEYDGLSNNQESSRKIRGVVPIVLQSDKDASMTNSTGSYNAVQNMNLGKKAGDRGFRPDLRTNLYFRERMK